MKKITLSLGTAIIFAIYAVVNQWRGPATTNTPIALNEAAPAAAHSPTSVPVSTATKAGGRSDGDSDSGTNEGSDDGSSAASPAPSPAPSTATAPAPAPSTPTGKFKDGTYTGAPADAYYGMVQTQAVIKGGALTNVNILQHPDSMGTSIYVANMSLPTLVSEAIQSQSANVNGVSGATEDSMAFVQSLSDALSQAAN